MKRMPRTWMGASVGSSRSCASPGCIAGPGYGGDVGVGYVGYVGGVYEPGGYEVRWLGTRLSRRASARRRARAGRAGAALDSEGDARRRRP